jgi:hypothetical protein
MVRMSSRSNSWYLVVQCAAKAGGSGGGEQLAINKCGRVGGYGYAGGNYPAKTLRFALSAAGVLGRFNSAIPERTLKSISRSVYNPTKQSSRHPRKIDKSHIAGRQHGGEYHSVE